MDNRNIRGCHFRQVDFMSELQDDLDRADEIRTELVPVALDLLDSFDGIVEAARRWVAVQEAITNKGSQPSYHQSVMARHQKEWPTLWAALVTTEDDR